MATAASSSPFSVPRELYPIREPFNSGMLDVGDGHKIYYEETGNPTGKPVVFLHGGPGGGSPPRMRGFFDPDVYRVVLFDQRGSGKSTPHACLENNTTWHLVADTERVREHLGIEKWLVAGGSWGSTLALAYAETHPERVTEIILRGIFMLRRKELLWFYQEGASFVFPDAWDKYVSTIPEDERDDFMTAYYKRLTSDDPEVRLSAARTWSVWEGTTSKLFIDPTAQATFDEEQFAIAFARIECHYFVNRGFFDRDDYLLANIDKIRHIPCVIVQGRYDMVCPMVSAWDLHKAWPESKLIVIPDAGHAAVEPGIQAALLAASDDFKPKTHPADSAAASAAASH